MSLSNLFDKCFRTSMPIEEKAVEKRSLFETVDDDSVQSDIVSVYEEYDVTNDPVRLALQSPEILPCGFDNTIEFWLKRLQFWCKKENPMKIIYTDPEGKKRNVSIDDFEKAMTEPDDLIRVFGKWFMYRKSYKSFEASREFNDATGRKRKETYFVELNLDRDIENAFKGKF